MNGPERGPATQGKRELGMDRQGKDAARRGGGCHCSKKFLGKKTGSSREAALTEVGGRRKIVHSPGGCADGVSWIAHLQGGREGKKERAFPRRAWHCVSGGREGGVIIKKVT